MPAASERLEYSFSSQSVTESEKRRTSLRLIVVKHWTNCSPSFSRMNASASSASSASRERERHRRPVAGLVDAVGGRPGIELAVEPVDAGEERRRRG